MEKQPSKKNSSILQVIPKVRDKTKTEELADITGVFGSKT